MFKIQRRRRLLVAALFVAAYVLPFLRYYIILHNSNWTEENEQTNFEKGFSLRLETTAFGQIVNETAAATAQPVLSTSVPPSSPPGIPISSQYGENGQPVVIDEKTLNTDQLVLWKKGYEDNSFNQYVSDKISVHRSLLDPREQLCKSQEYNISDLPATSVIICFYNEAWSVLLRTIHSVIDRSPPHLLKEIVLVDDASTMTHLKDKLDEYVSNFSKLKILRLKERQGLIRARTAGADFSEGKILTFLDSHCECTIGWLEPMLFRIHQNWTNVVTPIISSINGDTFEFIIPKKRNIHVGGFSWDMVFRWYSMPERERKRRKTATDPVRSPTMAGGLFSIHADFFNYLGKYDPGMEFWGGENLELSFKIWMCGGQLEILPCSIVGHIFRKKIPYELGVDAFMKNNLRLAEVWMDGYGIYYYERYDSSRLPDFGDISDRIALRKNLHCKSFSWYLENIYPERSIPSEALARGPIKSKAAPLCLQAQDKTEGNKVKARGCINGYSDQYWLLSKEGAIFRDKGCLDYNREKQYIETNFCHNQLNQKFEYLESGLIRLDLLGLCIELNEKKSDLTFNLCNPSEIRQQWDWNRQSPTDIPLHLQCSPRNVSGTAV